MKVRVRGISIYSDIIGGIKEVEAEEGAEARQLVLKLIPPGAEKEYGLVIFINGRPSSPERRVEEGDLIEIAPRFSGG